ncbi:MAG: hypothetical protein J07HR59_00140, partial [Halorubrum sp. J07HR59]
TPRINRAGLDLLPRLQSWDSHGTAPLGWEFQGYRSVDMTDLLAGPNRRYSSPRHGMDSELPSCLKSTPAVRRGFLQTEREPNPRYYPFPLGG